MLLATVFIVSQNLNNLPKKLRENMRLFAKLAFFANTRAKKVHPVYLVGSKRCLMLSSQSLTHAMEVLLSLNNF
jgi:hypothetical protein